MAEGEGNRGRLGSIRSVVSRPPKGNTDRAEGELRAARRALRQEEGPDTATASVHAQTAIALALLDIAEALRARK